MFFPPELGDEFLRNVTPLWESNDPSHVKLQRVWSALTGLQGIVLGHILLKKIGNRVFAGPFRGMQLIPEVTDRIFAPALLGTQGWELHDEFERLIAKPYKQIVHIGCGYGYYGIGLALRMPEVTIHAYESDSDSRLICRKMAEANGVAERLIVGEAFKGKDYARFTGSPTLVIMDVDGDEEELLDPQRFTDLQDFDVIVALHDARKPGLSTRLPLRFVETHDVRVIPNAPFSFPLDKIMGAGYVPDHFDNLLATWEGQAGYAPYGVFIKK